MYSGRYTMFQSDNFTFGLEVDSGSYGGQYSGRATATYSALIFGQATLTAPFIGYFDEDRMHTAFTVDWTKAESESAFGVAMWPYWKMGRFTGWESRLPQDEPTPMPTAWPITRERVWVGHMYEVIQPQIQRTWYAHGPSGD